MFVVVEATVECGRFEMAQDIQYMEETVRLRKAFGMLLLSESRISERGWNGSRRVSNPMREICTMNFRFIGSIVAKPFPCARIEARRSDLRTVNRLRGERRIIEHRDVRTWARGRVA